MALNFPIPTSVGQVYQDPTSGNTYVCTSLGPPAQWVGSGSSTSLDGTYLRKDASNDPVTGNLLLNPTTNVSPLTLQQPVGNTTPALKIENSGSGNSIEANGGFALSNTGVLSLGTALAIASGGTGATSQSAARTNLGATTVGNAVFTAVDEAAARTNLGATTVGNAVFTAANEAAARTAIAAPPVADPSFTGVVQTTGSFFSSGVTDGVAKSLLSLDNAGTTAHSHHGFFRQYTSNVATAAAIILSNSVSRAYNGGLALVRGRLSSAPQDVVFLDLVLHRGLSGVTVIQSSTVIGSPAARTYSVIGSGNRELTLAMASGTYNIEVIYQA